MNANDGKFMATVKIGPKGQIVIPKEIRDMFGYKPGDMLLVLADVKQGIGIVPFDEKLWSFIKESEA